MSTKFDQEFIGFNRWYASHRNSERSIDMDVKFLQESFDRAIKLIECANKDLKDYEGQPGRVFTK